MDWAEDHSVYLNRILQTQKQDFGGCVTSKLNRIWVRFSKMKVKRFNNDLYQHLSIVIFHAKNRLTHNYCGFYKESDYPHMVLGIINYTYKYERRWYFDQDQNPYTYEI